MKTTIDDEQIERFAAFLPMVEGIAPFNFCAGGEGVLFPAAGASGALDAFFFNVAHQFGFWEMEGDRYARPMIAPLNGVARKGSDFLFACTQRALNRDSDAFLPERLKDLSDAECDAMFHDDTGVNPLPMWADHLAILRGYARWFVAEGICPRDLGEEANAADKPLAYLLNRLKTIPGYGEDPLQKKAMLLAVILEHRPEGFLSVTDPESAVPIIDYHLQRSALRTGLVRVDDEALRGTLSARERVSEADEQDIRAATYEAVRRLVAQSGLSVAAVDYFFFTNRSRCPEMTPPQCEICPVQRICRRATELFQPVYRTSYY